MTSTYYSQSFLQPYNLNQLGNFSNEALYFPCLYIFILVFSEYLQTNKVNNIYLFAFSIFIIFGVYFRLHHAIVCINFFIFSIFLKIKDYLRIIILGILNLIVFFLIIKNTYLNFVFYEHLDYFNNNISTNPDTELFKVSVNLIEKLFIIITYPLLLTKFTSNTYIYYLFVFLYYF